MCTILIVDDERAFRSFVRDSLEMMGHEVIESANGKDGVSAFRRHKPDLVFVDIFMRERGGLWLIRELRAEFPESRLIVVSGGSLIQSAEFIAYARQLGVAASLRKPFSAELLAATVDTVLRDRLSHAHQEPLA